MILQGPDYTVYFCAKFDTTPTNASLFYGPYTGKASELKKKKIADGAIRPVLAQ